MERPNYRLGYVDAGEVAGRVVSAVALRKNSQGVEERTFCFFHNPCRCEKDYSDYRCGRNITCECVGDVPSPCGCDGNCEKFCECVGDCSSHNVCSCHSDMCGYD